MRPACGIGGLILLVSSLAHAETWRVPGDSPSLPAAIATAAPGDRIEVTGGRHCGALVDKRLDLVGRDGATIVGCASGPALFNGLRVGFLLLGEAAGASPADGTRITGFVFDGAGVSEANRAPLAFGVFGRFSSDVMVSRNVFLGTVQAVTNSAGDGWVITSNQVRGLTTLGQHGGGAGIVVRSAGGALAAPGGSMNPHNRPADNTVADNDIEGRIPDGLRAFSMAAILVEAADRTVVSRNRLRLPANPSGAAAGEGVLVTSFTAALDAPDVPGARETVVEENDGRGSELAVLVEHPGVANTHGLELRANRGEVVVQEPEPAADR
jgi:hypothetical protein